MRILDNVVVDVDSWICSIMFKFILLSICGKKYW